MVSSGSLLDPASVVTRTLDKKEGVLRRGLSNVADVLLRVSKIISLVQRVI